MKYQNNATRIRREILAQIAKVFLKDKTMKNIDRIPIDMIPKDEQERLRCCIYKERAIIKCRVMSGLGFSLEEQQDELKTLAEYAKEALKNKAKPNNILTILDIACAHCVQSGYIVTNACHGCMARPCTLNCPKKAIAVKNGQAEIDHSLCVDCGRCVEVCPYKAIIKVPIPCQDACPVGAITRNAAHNMEIAFDKCIFCGQCMLACPFGAIMERLQFLKILQALQNKTQVVAMVAPSIVGQFKGSLEQIAGALKTAGFAYMKEVAAGADITAEHEAQEFLGHMKKGHQLMTNSCCPTYTAAVAKHIPTLQPYVSTAKTPLHYTAKQVKNKDAKAITVFIGPCIAKRKEGMRDKNVDYVMTFEELDALFTAKNIKPEDCKAIKLRDNPTRKARGFATSCGVTAAMLEKMTKEIPLHKDFIDGLNKQSIKRLKKYLKTNKDINFLEVMGCDGGCVGGPCTIGKLRVAKNAVKKLAE